MAFIHEFEEGLFQARCWDCGWHSFPYRHESKVKLWANDHKCSTYPTVRSYGGPRVDRND